MGKRIVAPYLLFFSLTQQDFLFLEKETNEINGYTLFPGQRDKRRAPNPY